MFSLNLAIDRLPREASLLTTAGLHWLSVVRQDDMLRLARQLIIGLPFEQQTTLVAPADEREALLQALPAEVGPEHMALFTLAAGRRGAELKRLPTELRRAGVRAGLLMMMLPAGRVAALGGKVTAWVQTMQAWAERRGVAIVVLCHGQERMLPGALANRLSGLLRLERNDGGVRLVVEGWHNRLGWLAGAEYKLQLERERFAVRPAVTWQSDSLHEAEGVLIQQRALERMPPPAAGWRTVEQDEKFWQTALTATEGTLVAAVSHNEEVPELAQQLHRLRSQRGPCLRVAIRKLRPCLRNAEQELLLHCGANLIIPSGLSHAQFMGLLSCLQGQRWHRPWVENLHELLLRYRPPAASGLLSPSAFYAQADAVFRASSGEAHHQLLALPLRSGLSTELCLSQLNLRRQGDLACLVDDCVYLFLFACPNEMREAALGNICRLPWPELFSECRIFSDTEELPQARFEQDDTLPEITSATSLKIEKVNNNRHFDSKPVFLEAREG